MTKKPPAYQRYPNDWLGNYKYTRLSFAHRGLIVTLLDNLWEHRKLPYDLGALEHILRATADEISLLLPDVLQFFLIEDDHIVSEEMEAYRSEMEARRMQRGRNFTRNRQKSVEEKIQELEDNVLGGEC